MAQEERVCGGVVDQLGGEGLGSIHVVSKRGCVEGLRMLLDLGAEVNLRDEKYMRSALHYACDIVGIGEEEELDAAYESCVDILIQKGADINSVDIVQETPLHLGIKSNKFRCVRRLLQAGVYILANIHGDTPLHLAVDQGSLTIMSELCSHHVLPTRRTENEKNNYTLAPQHNKAIAIRKKNETKKNQGVRPIALDKKNNIQMSIVKEHILLEKEPSACSLHHQHWIECYTENGNQYFYNQVTKTSEWLLPKNISLSLISSHDIESKEEEINKTETILATVSPVVHRNQDHPLLNAVQRLNLHEIQNLLQAGAAPDCTTTSFSKTPLHIISTLHSSASAATAVRLLCDFGANTEAIDPHQNTPLHLSALHQNNTVLAALLDAGADAAARNIHGDTPLHLAVAADHYLSCQLLIQYGAPLHVVNLRGYYPISSKSSHLYALFQQRNNKIIPIATPSAIQHPPKNETTKKISEQKRKVKTQKLPSPPFSTTVMTDTEHEQGFRDPPSRRIALTTSSTKVKNAAPGCAGSSNPFYISSPNAASTPLPLTS